MFQKEDCSKSVVFLQSSFEKINFDLYSINQIDKKIESKITDAFILTDVTGSDHCPVGIEIKI